MTLRIGMGNCECRENAGSCLMQKPRSRINQGDHARFAMRTVRELLSLSSCHAWVDVVD